jgi:Domain of unknown function (DUF6894)
MPLYYFDVTSGHTQFIGEEGEELQGDRQARDCARSVLTETLKRPLSDLDTEAALTVRDAGGARFVTKLSVPVA